VDDGNIDGDGVDSDVDDDYVDGTTGVFRMMIYRSNQSMASIEFCRTI